MRSKLLFLHLLFSIAASQNYSLSFDGVDDYVVSSNSNYDLTNGCSIHLFVKSTR